MSTDHLPHDDPVWGSPAAEARPWGKRETLLAFGIAAVIAVVGGAAIYAATGHSSSQFIGPPGQHGPGPGGAPAGGVSGSGGSLGQGGPAAHGVHNGPPLHGQVVVTEVLDPLITPR